MEIAAAGNRAAFGRDRLTPGKRIALALERLTEFGF